MREAYLRKQDRKRQLLSWGTVLLAYLLIGTAIVLRGLFGVDSLSSGMGTIQVRIGSPEGEDEFSRLLPAPGGPIVEGTSNPLAGGESTAAEEALSPPPASEASPAAGASVSAPPPSTVAPPAPKAAPPAAKSAPKPTATSPAPAKAGSATTASAGTAGASGTPSAQASGGGGPDSSSLAGTGPVSLKGSEEGNSFETSFDTGSGKIGRSLYVPIFYYMPLPRFLEKAIYDAVPNSLSGLETAEVRKARLLAIYSMTGTLLTSKGEVPIAKRPSVWVMLQDAGYPVENADYKAGRSLKPVIIEFSVGAPSGYSAEGAVLLSSAVVSSSGFQEIDEAVLYGFRQAGFRNDSKTTVKGRFVYNFK